MAMTNIDSTKVKVYPAAGRSDAYKNSYLLTEDNLNTAIRCLYQRNFVVSYAANIVKFVIHGYYFEVDLTDSGIDTSGDLYAVIYLKQVLAQGQHSRLVSSDGKLLDSGDGKFNGVYFTTKESEITNKEGLDKKDIQILSGGQVPEKSYLRFKTSEILDRETNDLISSKFTTDSLTTSTATISSATISTAQITTLSGTTSLNGALQTASGSITPTNIMTNANLTAEVKDTAPKTLVISLVTTKGKD